MEGLLLDRFDVLIYLKVTAYKVLDLRRIKHSNVLVKYVRKFIVLYLKRFLELKVCWCGSTKFIVSGLKFFWNYKVLLIRYRVLGRDNEKRLRQGWASFSAFEISAFSTMDMLFLGGPGDHFLFISSFCTSLWGPTCYYLCSTQYGYCKDSDAISILFLQIAFLH